MARRRRWRKNGPLLRDKRRIVRLAIRGEIARMIVQGSSSKEIAQRLGVSVDTIRNHLRASMRRAAEMSEQERAERADVPAPAAGDSPRRRALELRKANRTYDAIAEALGVSDTTAKRWVFEELERLDADELRNADLARRLELERLDAMASAVSPRAMQGDTDAANTVLRIMERRSKLLGLDAPTKINVEQELRAAAREHGLDEELVVREAYAILKARSRS